MAMALLQMLLVLLAGFCVGLAHAACPSNCNGHGSCQASNMFVALLSLPNGMVTTPLTLECGGGRCACYPGYTSFDCAYRTCPTAAPWADFATGDDAVRSIARECSNRGKCNRDTGLCECDVGFSGGACERLALCRNRCSGHGRCLSMRSLASTRNDYNLLYSTTYATPWDADRIFGCVCDHGYSGVDCSLRMCAYGDDPVTSGQDDEIQALSCLCNGCVGTFTASFRGETTRPLNPTDSDATLKAALEELSTIREVTVNLHDGSTLCDADGVSAMVTFTLEHGDVPPLRVAATPSDGTGPVVTVETGSIAFASLSDSWH